MKTETWKPQASAIEPKDGLYIDDQVIFRPAKEETQRLPMMVALLLSIDFIATGRAFKIDDEAFKTWLSFDGAVLTGSDSLKMTIADTAVVIDAMRERYFASRVERAWQQEQQRVEMRRLEAIAEAEAQHVEADAPIEGEIPRNEADVPSAVPE